MDLTIVSVTGYKGSGKDTLADYLVEKHGFVKLSFADKLKEICKQGKDSILRHMPWVSPEQLEEFNGCLPWDGSKEGKGRELLQYVGTELGRNYRTDIWLNYWSLSMYEIANKSKAEELKIVVPDVRFVSCEEGNELTHLKHVSDTWDRGKSRFLSVRVDRPGKEGDSHSSEKSMDLPPKLPYNIVLNNNSDKNSLYDKFELLYSTGI